MKTFIREKRNEKGFYPILRDELPNYNIMTETVPYEPDSEVAPTDGDL